MSCNEQQDCFSVRRRKGPHPGPSCPVAAVGAVIRGLESLSLHDSQLAKGATPGLLQREIPPVLRAFGHLKPLSCHCEMHRFDGGLSIGFDLRSSS